MTFGPRILKTGIAVTVALYICSILNLDPPIFAGVAAILAIQPSIYRTWKQMIDQIITNTLGATLSLFFIYFFGENPITIGFVIMLVISLSLKLKMEKTIPLTLVTVLAIMSAAGSEDLFFTLERFIIIMIGTGAAMVVNIIVLPPKYQQNYFKQVQSTFQNMSLLLRTAISNELTEVSFNEHHKSLSKDIQKLEEQFQLFEEERTKLGKTKQLNAREIIVFKQMLKVLQEGEQIVENIEEHYFQSTTEEEDNLLFDSHLELLMKYHENLLLKYQGKIKPTSLENDVLEQSNNFFEQALRLYTQDKGSKQRLMIIVSSIMDYTFHLQRLDKLIHQYLKGKEE
ncbi:aromatic acid exporter family protein [Anaerobacillus alkaliphilus]|uniref:Aromatic acid exporter family protein n=1 Tax=Anaerobacillus alkaliphilus TaxID=1548597 RepID=A0A4Q0VNS2_9BACI|nr:aromatic acid exporter family protein [Anaerobacillus alkaliphilus]